MIVLKLFGKEIKFRIFLKLMVVFLISASYSVFSQIDTTKNANLYDTVINDFVSAYKDYAYIGKQIITPRETAIPWIAIGTAATGVGFIFDEDVREMSKRSQNKPNDKLYNITNEFGNTIYPVMLSGGIYLGGLFFKDEKEIFTAS